MGLRDAASNPIVEGDQYPQRARYKEGQTLRAYHKKGEYRVSRELSPASENTTRLEHTLSKSLSTAKKDHHI
jgi:hypothetical protein